MKTLETMTKDERSQLLFFESCAVDNAGRVKIAHMNELDMQIAERWDADGFVGFGRVADQSLRESRTMGSHFCILSEEAWRLAAEERKARAARLWAKRTWKTTAEADGEGDE